jgi:hypothetical protein
MAVDDERFTVCRQHLFTPPPWSPRFANNDGTNPTIHEMPQAGTTNHTNSRRDRPPEPLF